MAAPTINERHHFGTTLEYSADDSSYTAFSEVVRVKLPSMERAKTNRTKIDSTEMWKECMGSWKDPGKLEFDLYFTEGVLTTLLSTLFATLPHVNYYWRYSFPLVGSQSVPARLKFTGFLDKIDINEAKESSDDAVMVPCSVSLSGKPTFSAGS